MSTFCNVENKAYDDGQFVSLDEEATVIHVKNETFGHTLDGWPATFNATHNAGRWTLDAKPTIRQPDIRDYLRRPLP